MRFMHMFYAAYRDVFTKDNVNKRFPSTDDKNKKIKNISLELMNICSCKTRWSIHGLK